VGAGALRPADGPALRDEGGSGGAGGGGLRCPRPEGVKAMTSKRCSKCGEVKPAGDFYRDGKSRGGYRPECKRCRNRQRTQWARRRYVPKTGRRYRTKADRLAEQGGDVRLTTKGRK
jgi:hypothetical protein